MEKEIRGEGALDEELTLWTNTRLYTHRIVLHKTRQRKTTRERLIPGSCKLKNAQDSCRAGNHSSFYQPEQRDLVADCIFQR